MKTRVTALVVVALAFGASSAPTAEAKFCQTAYEFTSQRDDRPIDHAAIDQAIVAFNTACSQTGF